MPSPRIPLLAAVLLIGCRAQIQHGLDERQANEIQTVLVERGLEARKVPEPGKKPSWVIEVPEDRATDAVRVLAELGLPRPRTEGFSDVFGKGSLVPTPTEERALYLQALSGELARTLESVEGVVSARVHLVLPPPARPGAVAAPAKASAFLRVRPGAAGKVASAREELRALVAGAVEGLSPENVALVTNEVESSVRVPAETPGTVTRLRALAIALGATVSLLAMALVFLSIRLKQARSAPAAAPAPITARPGVAVSASRKAA